MRCVECGEREATVIWIDVTGPYRDVRHDGDAEESVIDAPPLESAGEDARPDATPRGPTLCEKVRPPSLQRATAATHADVGRVHALPARVIRLRPNVSLQLTSA